MTIELNSLGFIKGPLVFFLCQTAKTPLGKNEQKSALPLSYDHIQHKYK